MAQVILLSITLLVNISIKWVCYKVYIVLAGEKEVQLWRLLPNIYKYDLIWDNSTTKSVICQSVMVKLRNGLLHWNQCKNVIQMVYRNMEITENKK
jgi:hypothetical protein